MAFRLTGANIPQDRRIVIALTYIYGIGNTTAQKILKELKIDENIRAKDLSETDEITLREYIKKTYKIEGDLKREKISNIKRLKEIKCYRGIRHERRLPSRGQRTKTNTRTVRGNVRVTLLSGRKDTSQKT